MIICGYPGIGKTTLCEHCKDGKEIINMSKEVKKILDRIPRLMEPWNFVVGPYIMDYEEFIFDTEELPNGDFVLWLAIKDLPEVVRYFVNPTAEFVQTWIRRARLDVTAQKYDFMKLYLYLSRLQFANRGYNIWSLM